MTSWRQSIIRAHLSAGTQRNAEEIVTTTWQYLREIIYLFGPDKRKLPLLFLLFLGSSMLDLIGLGLVAPYIALVVNPSSLGDGKIGQFVAWIGLDLDTRELLFTLGCVLLAVFLTKSVAAIKVNQAIIGFSQTQQVRLRTLMMHSFQQMPYSEYVKRNSAEYIQSIQGLTGQFANQVTVALLRAASDGTVGLAILTMLAFANLSALLLLILMLGGALVTYDRLFRRNLHTDGRQANAAVRQLVKGIHEGIEGLKEIRVLGREAYFLDVVHKGAKSYAHYFQRSQLISTAPRYLLESLLVAFVILLVMITLWRGQDPAGLVPVLGMFGIAALRLLPTANMLSSSLMQLRFNRDAVSRLYADLRAFEDRKGSLERAEATPVEPDFRMLELRQVSFAYPQDDAKPVLKDVTLSLSAGESIGLVGPSGSGKTTLVDVLLGLLEPQSGNIEYNGHALRDVLADWRSNVAYLPQQVFLIDNTLRRNVALGEEDDQIDEPRVDKALRLAQLSELVAGLPNGLDTVIGERGVRLSGGQRQRIALARAFYYGRSVLVMDEATSALDNETEREIVDEIQRLKGHKTMIVIAHRLSTVQHCDRIYRMDKGQIVEEGTPEQVLSRMG